MSRTENEGVRLAATVGRQVTGEPRRGERLTLTVVATSGHAPWWKWVLRDEGGALVEESTTQFRVAADAETHGRARIATLEEGRHRGFAPYPWHPSAR